MSIPAAPASSPIKFVPMVASEACEAMIKGFETLRLTPYADIASFATIGWGHRLSLGEFYPNGITEAYAQMLFATDFRVAENIVNAALSLLASEGKPCNVNQNQFDALVDFAYNLGASALNRMIFHGIAQVPVQIPLWCNAKINGKEEKVKGLVRRRAAEVALWNKAV